MKGIPWSQRSHTSPLSSWNRLASGHEWSKSVRRRRQACLSPPTPPFFVLLSWMQTSKGMGQRGHPPWPGPAAAARTARSRSAQEEASGTGSQRTHPFLGFGEGQKRQKQYVISKDQAAEDNYRYVMGILTHIHTHIIYIHTQTYIMLFHTKPLIHTKTFIYRHTLTLTHANV